MGSVHTNDGRTSSVHPLLRFYGVIIFLLFSFVLHCRAGETVSRETPDISRVQHHLKQVFYLLRPDLRNSGFELESVGGNLNLQTWRWFQLRGEFRGPVAENGKRIYFRLFYRLTGGQPSDVQLSEGVMRGRRKLTEFPPVGYQGRGLPIFLSGSSH